MRLKLRAVGIAGWACWMLGQGCVSAPTQTVTKPVVADRPPQPSKVEKKEREKHAEKSEVAEKPAPKKAVEKAKSTKTAEKAEKSSAPYPEKVSDTSFLPKLLQEVEAKYTAAKTLEAKFNQTTVQKALGKTKESSGTLKIKRPNKMRWETEAPDKNLLVSDGKTFWFYTPPFEEGDSGQLMIKKTAEVQSRMANALLSGSFSMAKDMKIEPKGASHFVLIPKRGTAGTVIRAEIAIDPASKTIQSVTLLHDGGNEAKIRLSQIHLGKAEPDASFQFKAPPGTEVLKQ